MNKLHLMETRKHVISAIATAAIAMGMVQSAQAANIGFSVIENSASNTLTTNLAGAVVTAVNDETWKIDISGTGIGSLDAGYWNTWVDHVWVDDDAGFINRISKFDSTTLLAESDILLSTFPIAAGSFCGTNGPLANGVTCFIGDNSITDDYFATWVYDTSAVVPVPAAVWLFGSGLLGLVGMARRKKA